MSIRGIASVGVALCVAMTTFSIYLGIVEHVYPRSSSDSQFVLGSYGTLLSRDMYCYATNGGRVVTVPMRSHSSVTPEPCSTKPTRR